MCTSDIPDRHFYITHPAPKMRVSGKRPLQRVQKNPLCTARFLHQITLISLPHIYAFISKPKIPNNGHEDCRKFRSEVQDPSPTEHDLTLCSLLRW